MKNDASQVCTVEAHWPADEAALRAIRQQVFVHEQRVSEALEYDGQDDACWHVLAYYAGEASAVACGRLMPSGQIGRMAVLAGWRGQGVGSVVLQRLLTIAKRECVSPVWLSAQQHAIPFYERHGFICQGEPYEEVGIPHHKMVYGDANKPRD